MKASIETLSPLHIGAGERLSMLSYVSVGAGPRGEVFVLSERSLRALPRKLLDEFIRWVSSEPQDVTWQRFAKDVGARGILENLAAAAEYRVKNLSGEPVLGEIETFVKTAGMPYVPGSEIKGAFRTACLYWRLMHDDALYEQLKRRLLDFRKSHEPAIRNAVRGWGGPDWKKAKRLLSKKMSEIERWLQCEAFRSTGGDAKTDVMKYLQVSDSEPIPSESALGVAAVEVVGMSRRRRPVLYEVVSPGVTFPVSRFALTGSRDAFSLVGMRPSQTWPVEKAENIMQCCREFSTRLLEEEKSFLLKKGLGEIARHLEDAASANKAGRPVLRLGKNEGFLSLTVSLALKDRDPDLYSGVIVPATRGRSYPAEFPKTRRVARLGRDRQTMGWCTLSVSG